MKAITGLLGGLVLLGGCAGAPLRPDVPIVDYHQHLVSPTFAPIVKFPVRDGRALVAMLDAAGVQRAVVLSVGYSLADERKNLPDPARQTHDENDWTSAQVAASHGRLIGFCSVNPLRPEALDEIERCLKLPGMRGLKLHFGNSGVSLRDPAHAKRMAEVFAVAGRHRTPILVHMRARGGKEFGAEDAQLFLDKLVPKAPDSEIVIAHFGGAGPGYPDQADEVMGVFAGAIQRGDPRTRNLYFDVATILTADSPPEDRARIARRIRQVGARRVLYGSDLIPDTGPSITETWALYRTSLGLTPAELRTIAGNRTRFSR